MDKPWFGRMFDRMKNQELESAQAKAEDGDAEAQFGLGLRFANCESLDYPQAAHWYLRAADQNHALAQFNLGIMFARGQGVDRDEAKAAMWIQRAARQGDAGAQHNLGLRHRRASFEGLPEDASEAKLESFKWFRLAAAQGYMGSNDASECVALGMTNEELIEGNNRAAAFVASGTIPIGNCQ